MYYIIDEKNNYYCYNDFNGKAVMLPPDEQGNPPSIARMMDKNQAETKIDYLMNHTSNNSNNHSKKDRNHNNFFSLQLKLNNK